MNIDIIIKQGEGESIEFKESFSEKVIETLVAFANARGGKVLIGVKDNGKIIGTTVGKESIQQWVNEVKNKTETPIIPIVDIEKYNGKKVILFSIVEYPIKPISFRGKYYKRTGNSNHTISLQEAIDLYLQSLNTSWDYYPDPNMGIDDIDLEKVNNFVQLLEKRKGIRITDDFYTILRKFELINKDNKPTFACSLLFKKYIGACNKIVLAKFQGIDKMIAKDDLVIEDSLIEEVDDVMNFIKKNISKAIILKPGDTRNTEVWDYPLEALREIVINSIIHKDYRATPNIQIYIYNDRIEIANPGKFPNEMSIEGLKSGIYNSKSPNKLIAKTFKELGIIEEYGSGVKKIMNSFKINGLEEPIIDTSQGFITYVCYKQGHTSNYLNKVGEKVGDRVGEKVGEKKLTLNQQKILDCIGLNSTITIVELSKVVGMATKNMEVNISKLKEKGVLKRVGPAKGGYWEIVDDL